MSKKLGLALLFVGAYITILGGLFFLMHFYGESHAVKPEDYDWVWGVLTGVITIIGAVVATKKYLLGYIGFGISALGAAATLVVAFIFFGKFNYLSPFLMVGAGLSIAGIIIGVIFHTINTAKAKKYGESLL